ncbi:RNA polymerase sigma factor [Streptomyces zhihengii]
MADETLADRIEATYGEQGDALLACARYELLKAGIPPSRMSPEDLVQEAVVVALTNRERTAIRNLGAYLRAVIRNRVRDEERRRGVADPLDTAESAPVKVLWVSPVEDDIAGRVDLERALASMSPQQRRLLLLAKGYGYTHRELADFTRLNRGTIATHLARATAVLAAAMAAAFAGLTTLFGLGRVVAIPVASAPGAWGPDGPLFAPWVLTGTALAGICGLNEWLRRTRRTALRRTDVLRGMIAVKHLVHPASSRAEAKHYARELGIPPGWIDEKTLRKGRLPAPRSIDEANDGFHLPLFLPSSGRSVRWIKPGQRNNELVHVPTRSTASSGPGTGSGAPETGRAERAPGV